MKGRVLPVAPRSLAPGLSKRLWWGTALMLSATATITLILVATLFMFLLYGIPASAILPRSEDKVRVNSRISQKEQEILPAGDRVSVVKAPVKVNETVIEARGYGPAAEVAQVGDTVEILVPRSDPSGATLRGYQAYPVPPRTLLVFAGLFTVPGLLAATWALARARKSRTLLERGVECRGTRLRTIPLPRPLKDMALVRWEYSVEGESGRFWALQKADWKEPALLAVEGKAALLHNLLTTPVVADQMVDDQSGLSRVFAGLNTALLIFCVLAIMVFSLI